MKMALIGAGGIGNVHLKVYESMPDVEVVAVVDVNVERTADKLKNKSIKIYDCIDDMLANEDVDFVDICTPTYLHEEHAVKAMNKGIHVLCEKPIALTKESADNMVKAAKDNGVIFMIAHVIRFWPHYEYLKKCFDERKFGKLYTASFSRIGEIPRWTYDNWWMDEKRSGRAPLDLHIHDADFVLYLLGKPNYITGNAREDYENITYITACYEYDDCFVNIEGGFFGAPYPFGMSYRAVFEKAVLEYKNDKLMVYENGKQPEEIKFDDTENPESGINISSTNGYENEIRYFIECLKAGKHPEITTPESSAESLLLVKKTIESAKLGQKIKI